MDCSAAWRAGFASFAGRFGFLALLEGGLKHGVSHACAERLVDFAQYYAVAIFLMNGAAVLSKDKHFFRKAKRP